MAAVTDALALFPPNSLSWRLVCAVLTALPKAPALEHYATVADAARALGVADAAEAAARANEPHLDEIVNAGATIDATDQDRPYRLSGDEAGHEVQVADAVLKSLLLGWFAARVGTGNPQACADAFRERPSGRALIAWWASMDVALPLSEVDVGVLLEEHGPQQLSRLAGLLGDGALSGVSATTRALIPTLQRVVELAAQRCDPLALAASPFVPGLMASSAQAGETVAARADRMPVYKLLAARLAAESAVR